MKKLAAVKEVTMNIFCCYKNNNSSPENLSFFYSLILAWIRRSFCHRDRRIVSFHPTDEAESVTLTASATTVTAGTMVTLTCTANGGNPRPGLELYRLPGNHFAKSERQPNDQVDVQLVYSRRLTKQHNGDRYVCRTLVDSPSIPNLPVVSSAEITFDVQCEYSEIRVNEYYG